MITHNGTYLGAATHHGMPIVAATMGGKMILDNKWLLPATQLAIVAAFGAEGTEVIRKTNDYLNHIATTDPQRALQISGFINEDPMLSGYIAGVVPKSVRYVYIEETSASPRNGIDTLLSWNEVGRIEMGFMAGSSLNRIINSFNLGATKIDEIPVIATTNFSGWKANTWIDGVAEVSSTSPNQMHIFGWNDTGATNSTSCQYIRIYGTDDTTLLRNLVPCVRKDGTVCFYDLIEGRPHYNDRGTLPFQMRYITTPA